MICALPGRLAVVVAGSVWAAVSQLGDPGRGGGVVGAGFPSATTVGPSRYVRDDAASVDLEGGSWGPGRLVRSPSGEWRWRVKVKIDPYASSDGSIWTAGPDKLDLRLRLALRIPCVLDDMRVDSAGRRRLRAALAEYSATEVVEALAQGRVDAAAGAVQPCTGARAANCRTSSAMHQRTADPAQAWRYDLGSIVVC